MNHINLYTSYCQQLSNTQKLRKLPVYNAIDAENTLNFYSNDYLGLSKNKEFVKYVAHYASRYGVGSRSSRILLDRGELFNNLESKIAKAKNTEAALILNSGYQANISVLSTLCNKQVLGSQALVFFDKLNHGSLYQGVKLSEAHLLRYHHLDNNHLKKCLEKYIDDPRPKFIVSETVFGMDGTMADIGQMIKLAKEYNAFLYLDEAHATGVFGNEGYGLSTFYDFQDIAYLIMGTFSKALGVFGAYVASKKEVINYLVNKCSGFVYSTALPLMIVGLLQEIWDRVPGFEKERADLRHKADFLRNKLKEMGLNIGNSSAHIIKLYWVVKKKL